MLALLRLGQLLLQDRHARIKSGTEEPIAILISEQRENLVRDLFEIGALRRRWTEYLSKDVGAFSEVLQLQRRIGRADPDVNLRRHRLVEQFIGDLVDPESLEKLCLLSRQRQNDRIGLVSLLQLYQ